MNFTNIFYKTFTVEKLQIIANEINSKFSGFWPGGK